MILMVLIPILSFGICYVDAAAQVRGVYPLGMSAINSGSYPKEGFAYSNQFLFYKRGSLVGPDGEVVKTGTNSIMMDMNTFMFGYGLRVFGASVASSATLPIANNSLASDIDGPISGGGGFADSYYLPLILGWETGFGSLKAAYGFLAPTGKFDPAADDNVGSGYWTHTLSFGQSIYLLDRSITISAFELLEIHTEQEGTGITPGQTLDLDYSVTHLMQLSDSLKLELGVVGYGQWQISDHENSITLQENATRYSVNAIGLAGNIYLLNKGVSLGLKYFYEYENTDTFKGYSVQITGAVQF